MLRLIFANLWRRPVHTLLTAAAVALSVSLVVSTTSGYASAEKAVRGFVENFLGSDDARLSSGSDSEGMPESLIDELQADPAVFRAFGRVESSLPLRGPTGEVTPSPIGILGIDPATDGYLERLELDSGRKLTSTSERSVMLDLAARDALGVALGDMIQLPGPDGTVELEVVGFIYKPSILTALGFRTAYVPLQTLQEATRPQDPERLSTILIEYELDADDEAFIMRWQGLLAERDAPWELGQIREDREAVDRGLRGMNLLSLLGGMVSLLAATFIVFGTLSMGVAERQRTLAMLRAVGATRLQVALSVIGEGIGLAMLGVLIGVPIGLLFILGLTNYFADIFSSGMAIGWIGIAAGVFGMALAATVAAAVPAWMASRVDPLAAMRPAVDATKARPPWQWAIAGILLILTDALVLWPPIGVTPLSEYWERTTRFWLHMTVGMPMLMLGFFLIAPLLIWIAEKLFAWPAAVLMRVQPALLRQQLSGGMWRAAGTAAALMVGPAVLIVMNTQGRSGIEGWQLPDNFPDVFLFNRNGIPTEDLAKIGATEGIRQLPDGTADITPLGYLHPTLGDSFWAIGGAAFVPDKTMFIAVEPKRIFEMMTLEFTAGDTATAQRMLDHGQRVTLADGQIVHGSVETIDGEEIFLTLPTDEVPAKQIPLTDIAQRESQYYLIITQEFRELRGLGPGDPFILNKPGSGILSRLRGEPVEFIIVGVVRSPGIDLMVATFDLGREFTAESAASVFGTIDDARELFGLQRVFLVAANLELGVQKDDLVARLADELGDTGISVGDVRQLKYDIQEGLRDLLLVASTVAWAALIVASLGVTNTVMAGVRARRYQLGVLRAIGVTRGEVLRLVIAEAALLGCAAALLGVGAGLTMALNARQLQQWTVGYTPPLRIAWDVVWTGVAAVLTVSILAALWPAWSTARTQVLRLLQSGRASA